MLSVSQAPAPPRPAAGICTAAFLVSMVVSSVGSPAPAEVIRVCLGEAGDTDVIGQAVAGASSGDTILIAPGRYYEHIPIEEKSITLISADGPDVTILDGSRDIPDRAGSIIYKTKVGPDTLAVVGLTLEGGRGSPNGADLCSGGAINWWSGPNGGGRLDVAECVFVSNRPEDVFDGGGGALFVSRADVRLSSSHFSKNQSNASGSTIRLEDVGAAIIEQNELAMGSAETYTLGAEIWGTGGDITIQDNVFLNTEGGRDGSSLDIRFLNVECRRNVFEDHGTTIATTMSFQGGNDVEPILYRFEFAENLVWHDLPHEQNHISLSWYSVDATVEQNTFVSCNIRWLSQIGTIDFRNNLVYETSTQFTGDNASGTLSCNDAWPIGFFVSSDGYVLDRNVAEDPLFCDFGQGEFTLSRSSICSPDKSPKGCGLIGRYETSCEGTTTERVTWGQIKARYRR
jgi:hypothetical protein